MQALYETKNYVVVVGKYLRKGFAKVLDLIIQSVTDSRHLSQQGVHLTSFAATWVQNKQTLVVEYYVNSLPKAVYLAQESDSTLDKLMKGDDPSLAQLHLLVSDDNVH